MPRAKAVGPALALIPRARARFPEDARHRPRIEDAIERLLGARRAVDLGILRLRLTTEENRSSVPQHHEFGLGGLTIDREAGPKWIGGRRPSTWARFARSSPTKCARARARRRRYLVEAPIVNVAIANGRYFGGGMLVAPEAIVGRPFDVISMANMERPRPSRHGSHLSGLMCRAGRHETRGAVVEAEASFRMQRCHRHDGEKPGDTPRRAHRRGAISFTPRAGPRDAAERGQRWPCPRILTSRVSPDRGAECRPTAPVSPR